MPPGDWARMSCRARSFPTSMRFSSRPRTPQSRPSSRRSSRKVRKMIYTSDADHPTRDVPTPAERAAFVLSDPDILALAAGRAIEGDYGRPMDMEWAKDGETGELSSSKRVPKPSNHARKRALKTYRSSRRAECSFGLEHWRGGRGRQVCLIDSPRTSALRRRCDSGDADDRPGPVPIMNVSLPSSPITVAAPCMPRSSAANWACRDRWYRQCNAASP